MGFDIWKFAKSAGEMAVRGAKAAVKIAKDVGRGIVKIIKGEGKFMGKYKTTGALGVMTFLPGVGAALGNGIINGAKALFGAEGLVPRGLDSLFTFAANTVKSTGRVMKNATAGVRDTIVEFSKTAAQKMGFEVDGAASNFFGGGDSAFSKSFGSESRFQNLTSSQEKIEKLNTAFNYVKDSSPADIFGEPINNAQSFIKQPPKTDFFGTPPNPQQSALIEGAKTTKQSLLSKGKDFAGNVYTSAKDSAIKGVKDTVSSAPEQYVENYLTGELDKVIYGDPEEAVAVEEGYTGFGGAQVIQAQTLQGYSTQINANQFLQQAPAPSNYGYSAQQYNTYGQNMNAMYRPAKITTA